MADTEVEQTDQHMHSAFASHMHPLDFINLKQIWAKLYDVKQVKKYVGNNPRDNAILIRKPYALFNCLSLGCQTIC